MNWDAKIREASDEWISEDHVFMEGAEWMINQLRTDDAVEQVAKSLHSRSHTGQRWEKMPGVIKGRYLDDARAAINALIGED